MVNTVDIFLPRWSAFLEKERPNAFLWSPVLLGFGIGVYFLWPEEPSFVVPSLLCCALLTLIFWRRENLPFRALFLISLGFTLTCLAAQLYGTPMLDRPYGPALMEGTVLDIEQTKTGQRFLLGDLFIKGMPQSKTPRRIHLTLSEKTAQCQKAGEIHPGQHLQAVAELLPLSEPLVPGGFDFRRNGFFRGIGGTGFIMGRLELTEAEAGDGGAEAWINRLRQNLQKEIKRTLSGDRAGLAIILLTGDKTFLSPETSEAMRAVGLAHLLAIAGLHVGLVAGIVFFLTRFGMALFPSFALRHNIKKIAAFLALLAIIFYTLQVGAPVPTRRSLLMTGIVLVAIMFDRASLSLHTVALAAFLLLLIWPYLLLHPSFQLSFAAVVALIAVHGMGREKGWRLFPERTGWFWSFTRHAASLGGMSFVATFATLPASLFHFQEAEIYSVLANTLAIPLTSLFLMPLCVMVDVLWPLGMAWVPLQFVGPGIGVLIEIATQIAALPGAFYKPPPMPMAYLVVAGLSGLSFCFMKSRLRWMGLVGMTIMAALTFDVQRPSIIVSPDGHAIGWATRENMVITTDERPNEFLASYWAPVVGLPREKVVFADKGEHLACDSMGCSFTLLSQRVVWIKDPVALPEACAHKNDILISPQSDYRCDDETRPMITRADLHDGGSFALYQAGNTYIFRHQREGAAKRPWAQGWKNAN